MTSPISTNGLIAGAQPPAGEPGLRLVFFGLSIVSDWENPAATSHRALLHELANRGHQVVFLEERRNAPTVGLLKQRGPGPVKAFGRRYADIPYRTYDLPSKREMDVWLGREASTADAVVVFQGAPAPCVKAIERLEASHALKLFEREVEPAGSLLRTALSLPASDVSAMPYAPVVSLDRKEQGDRDIDVLIVAYDDGELAGTVALALPDATLLSAGSAAIPDVPFVPEVELSDWFQRTKVTVVADGQGAPVRGLLPLASGSSSVLVTATDVDGGEWPFVTSDVDELPAALSRARGGAPFTPDLSPFDAASRARELEALVVGHQRT